ncbi:MAG: hypothetical protein LBD15_04050 [Holosporales bacterium]|jgi:mevalonate kinase|nr:hypothetical protein [Holosporales bacterium]
MLRTSSATKTYEALASAFHVYSLPGKALLFGEYGMLLGFTGVAVTLPTFRMQVSCAMQHATMTPAIHVYSTFLKTGHIVLTLDSLEEEGFFQSTLAPYKDVLRQFYENGEDLIVFVEKSFPPHLGMGSSSALLASLHTFLFDSLYQGRESPLASSVFFHNLHESLKRIQGTGSGYDATLQLASQELAHPQLWRYQRSSTDSLPEFSPISGLHGHYGTILATHLYAETKTALARFSEEKHFIYARVHGALAEAFLKDPHPDNLSAFITKAQDIQKQQGILPDIDLIRNLHKAGIPFKSLGAGFGDCLWSPWTACQLHAFRKHIVTEIVLP